MGNTLAAEAFVFVGAGIEIELRGAGLRYLFYSAEFGQTVLTLKCAADLFRLIVFIYADNAVASAICAVLIRHDFCLT